MEITDVKVSTYQLEVVDKPLERKNVTKYSRIIDMVKDLKDGESVCFPEAMLNKEHMRSGLGASAKRRGFKIATSVQGGMVYVWKR